MGNLRRIGSRLTIEYPKSLILVPKLSIMTQNFEKTCDYCGNHFIATNARKRYCSGTCRTYASQERRGSLNGLQLAIKEGRVKTASISGPMASGSKEKIITDLATGFLESLFSISGKYYFGGPVEKDQDGETIDHPHPYNDIENGVQRIRITPSGNFIVTSMCKPVIEEIRKDFKGSKIMVGTTQEIRDGSMQPPNYLEKSEQGRRVARRGRVYTQYTYSTILPRKKVVKKAGIEVSLI